ncbi:MAG: flagellar filament capping protein FliD [Leptospiraceae bacterium]|nr:flagellar filament capping protein FliD [Leptospiraceae bacterium]
MPAPQIMDLGSGMDTRGTIKKLMDLERIPIQRLDQQNKLHEIRISAWNEVRKHTTQLENESRNLQSFSGSFAVNAVVSSIPGVISGQATPQANPGKQEIEVVQLATNHALRTNPLEIETELPKGSFTIKVDEQKLDLQYSGGKPKSLLNYLKNRTSTLLDINGVQIDAQNMIIALRSKKSGARGKMEFEDPDGLLQKIGLIGSQSVEEKEWIDKPIDWQADKIRFQEAQDSQSPKKTGLASFKVSDTNKQLYLNASGQLQYSLPLRPAAKVSFKLSIQKPAQADEKAIDSASNPDQSSAADGKADSGAKEAEKTMLQRETGPRITVRVGDIELKGQNINRTARLQDQTTNPAQEQEGAAETQNDQNSPKPMLVSVGVYWKDKQGKNQTQIIRKEVPFEQSIVGEVISFEVAQLSGGESIEGLFIENKDASVVLAELITTTEESKTVTKAVNETTPAQDAIAKINGIEIKRSQNRNLTDIIDGLSLDLNQKTDGSVTVSVETRADDIIQDIQRWMEAYNQLLVFCRELGRNSKSDFQANVGPNGQPIVQKEKAGLFASDSTLRQLITKIRMQTAQSFPVLDRNGFSVLSDIGISTGAPGQNWDDIKTGLLVLEEGKLRESLKKNPEGVRQLFASDVNEDNIKDNGVAIKLLDVLKPYNQRAGGLITARIDLLQEKIKSNKQEGNRKELSLQDKEENLRRRFGRMESSVKRNQSISEYLKRQGQNNQ